MNNLEKCDNAKYSELLRSKYVDISQDISEKLPQNILGQFFKIIQRMVYGENLIQEDILNSICSQRKLYELTKFGAIRKYNNKWYVNPLMANSCQYIPKDLYEAFKEELSDSFPEWIKQKYEELN